MITDNFWKQANGFDYITAGNTKWPEGFDVIRELKKVFSENEVVSEFGCGYGRLAPAFNPEKYNGFDINRNAINRAKIENPDHAFYAIDYPEEMFLSDSVLAYTVLLHISDEDINYCIGGLCQTANRVVVAEILGRKWRGPGIVPVFNRDLTEYLCIFRNHGFLLNSKIEYDYKHYPDTKITLLDFWKF